MRSLLTQKQAFNEVISLRLDKMLHLKIWKDPLLLVLID